MSLPPQNASSPKVSNRNACLPSAIIRIADTTAPSVEVMHSPDAVPPGFIAVGGGDGFIVGVSTVGHEGIFSAGSTGVGVFVLDEQAATAATAMKPIPRAFL